MSASKETLQTLLKTAGYSTTKPRLQIFEALIGQEPLAMNVLIKKVPGIDRASVYRTIEVFEKLGIVQRLHTGWKYKIELSDKFAAHHHHLTCVHCGTAISINERELEQFIERIADGYHFVPTAHQIEVQGQCKDCQDLTRPAQA